MFNWLKKYFIPHEGNEHRPHILRNENTRIIIAGILFLELSAFLLPTLTHLNNTGGMAAVLPAVLGDLANKERETEQLPDLTVNPLLTKAAELKANDMATKGYFAHTSPEGKTPWFWIEQAGYNYQYAGENLAINFSDSADVTNAWMESPSHRANIVKGQYTEMGTGIATGVYQGRQTIFVAQVYASPYKAIIMPAKKVAQVPVVKNIKKEVAAAPKVEKLLNVLGEETGTTVQAETVTPLREPTFMQKVLASPHNTTNRILLVILGVMVVALLLNIFIKIKHHHIDLATNGLAVLAIVGGIILTNNYISKQSMVILPSLDYTNEQVNNTL